MGANRFANAGGSRLSSLFNTPASQTQSNNTATQQLPDMNEPVQPDALRRAWKEYTNANPTEKLLNNVIVGYLPQLVEGTQLQYLVTFASPAQLEIITPHKAAILHYIKQKVRNTHITIDYKIAEEGTLKQAFSPREKIQEMIASNPAIQTLISSLNLEIG